ncbi:hypothetical protein BT69DRAFT_1353982, partial [Atractiella rhizophila]
MSPEELLDLPISSLTVKALDEFSHNSVDDAWYTRFLLSLVPSEELAEDMLVKVIELAKKHAEALKEEDLELKVAVRDVWERYVTWKEVVGERSAVSKGDAMDLDGVAEEEEELELDIEDPWASTSQASTSHSGSHGAEVSKSTIQIVEEKTEPFVPLRQFLLSPLLETAILLASSGHIATLLQVFTRHEELRQDALSIIICVPAHLPLSTFTPFLSGTTASDLLSLFHTSRPISILLDLFNHLVLVGITSHELETLGQELVCLARMVYERNLPSSQNDVEEGEEEEEAEEEWTLERWRSLSPLQIITAYFSRTASNPESLKGDYLRLVSPYLDFLRNLSSQKIHSEEINYLLLSYMRGLHLPILECFFQLSRPDLSAEERIVTDDRELCTLALVAVYEKLNAKIIEKEQWEAAVRAAEGIMGCLPALPSTNNTSVASSIPTVLSASFNDLQEEDIPPLLDLADLHLSASLSFSTLCDLSFEPLEFLRAFGKKDRQILWLRKLVLSRLKFVGETKEELGGWEEVVQGMKEVWETGKEGGCLEEETVGWEVGKAVIGNGSFKIAKLLLERLMEPGSAEKLVLEQSKEFYDNSTEGNANRGMMKWARECLSIVPDSPTIARQRSFIDATSQFFSYFPASHPSLSPIQVRLSTDKIALMAHLLSSNKTAYKHPEVLFDLLRKLSSASDGQQAEDEGGEIRTYAMCVEGAVQAADWTVAELGCEKMISLANRGGSGGDKGRDVAWRGVFALAKMEDYPDLENRKTLIGHAALLCPPETISDVLLVLRRIEEQENEENAARESTGVGQMDDLVSSSIAAAKEKAKASYLGGLLNFNRSATSTPTPNPPSLPRTDSTRRTIAGLFSGGGGERRSESTERKASVASLFGGRGGRDSPDPSQQQQHRTGFSSVLGNRFERGVGWLIGGDGDGEEG